MKNLIIFVFISICVSSCAVGYSSPKDDEPYAVISGDHSYIYTFKEDGCITSYSYIKDTTKIYPDTPAFINYQEKIGSNHFCSMWFSFVPEAGATYKVLTYLERDEKEKASIFIPIFTGASCIAAVMKIKSDGKSILVKLDKFEPKKQSSCTRAP